MSTSWADALPCVCGAGDIFAVSAFLLCRGLNDEPQHVPVSFFVFPLLASPAESYLRLVVRRLKAKQRSLSHIR